MPTRCPFSKFFVDLSSNDRSRPYPTTVHSISMQAHFHRLPFVMLLLFPLIVDLMEVALASPLRTMHSKSRVEQSKFTSKVLNNFHTSHHHQNHAAFTRTKSAHRQATAVQLETWRVQMPSITEIVTEIIEETTKLPSSLMLSEFGTDQAHTLAPHSSIYYSAVTSTTPTTSPTTSIGIYTVPPKPTSTLAVDTDLGSSPTASPHTITERRFFELPTATLVGVAVAGSVAVNLFIMVLWILLRHRCSRKVTSITAAEGELGLINDTEKEKSSSQRDVIQMTRGGTPGLLGPRGTSPVELDVHPPPSTHQPLPMPQSSFWSAASSQWTIERARSHGNEAHLGELEESRHFTTFDLDTPVNPDLNSYTLTNAPETIPKSVHQMDRLSVDSSSEDKGDKQTLIVPSAFRPSCGESSTDPRSPRRLSIPMFLQNYSSPSVSHYLPPHTQSTMNTSERASYGLDAEGGIQNRESSRRVVEHELGYGSVAASATSLASLPSVSSEVMTPRRHWTFVDIHGHSSYTASLQDGILDRFSGTGSSQTLAGDVPGASRGLFERGSISSQLEAAFSEPSGAGSFLHTDFGDSAGSISQHRLTDARRDTLHSFDHQDSIHTH
jgi:hypothetical protein